MAAEFNFWRMSAICRFVREREGEKENRCCKVQPVVLLYGFRIFDKSRGSLSLWVYAHLGLNEKYGYFYVGYRGIIKPSHVVSNKNGNLGC